MANIGKLTVDLTLASQRFEAGIKRVNSKMATMRKGFANVTKSMGGMQARIAGLVGVAGLGALANKSLKTIDLLAKTSDRLGISTDKLAGLQHAAAQTGASTEAFNMGLQRMVRRLGQVASTGTGEAAVALERLGIAVEDIKNLSPDQQFALIAEKMKDVANQGEKVFLTQKLFDSEGVKLLNTLNLGADGLEKMITEAEKLGFTVDRIEAAKIEAANDAIARSQRAIEGVSNKAVIQLAPLIEAISNNFIEAATEGEGFATKTKNAIEKVTGFVGVFADGIRGIKVILKGVETAALGMGSVFANVFEFLINDVFIKFNNAVTNVVLAPIREILEFGAQFSDTAAEMLASMDSLGKAKGFDFLRNIAGEMTDSFRKSSGELQALMLETIPSELMKEKLDSIYEKAQENAEKVAEDIKKKSEEILSSPSEDESDKNKSDDKEDPEKDFTKKKTFLEKFAALDIQTSKRVAQIKQAIKVKEVLANSYKSISEAVASAPFPKNIPAIAFATAESAINLAGVKSAGSFLGGGFTGTGIRSGGTDGKGGMDATVHPWETVIDHEKLKNVMQPKPEPQTVINVHAMDGKDAVRVIAKYLPQAQLRLARR